MKSSYRAGAIGRTGRGNFGHGLHTCYQDVANVDLVAIADDNDEGRLVASGATGARAAYADYREMLENEDLDIVSVCPRWVDCHEEMIHAALDAGCHVYSEKPMTATPEAADRIIHKADSAGLKIAVAHQAAYLPQLQATFEEILNGRIGEVCHIRSAGKMDHRGGGEDLLVLGTHLFNLMRILVGDPTSVWGHVTVEGRPIQPEDAVEANEPIGLIAGDVVRGFYAFEHGVTAEFESRRRSERDGRPYGMEIQGTKGAIAFNAHVGEVTLLEDDVCAPWEADQSWAELEFETAPLMSGNALAMADLVACIESGAEPISSAKGARTALEMILGIYASQVSGQRVALPLQDRRHPLDVWKSGN